MYALSGRPILPVRLQQQRGQRSVRCGQLFCCRQRHHGHMQCLSCWRVLLGRMQLVERKRAVWRGQLLDCRQWCNCGLLCMPLRHLQRDRGVHFCWSLFCLPCWGVLPCRLLIVERERRMRSGQLLDRGQWHQRIMHSLSRRSILPFWLWEQRRQRGVRCWQFLCDRQRGECAVHGLPCGIVLPCGMLVVERERVVWCGQLLDCGQRHQLILLCVWGGKVQRDERVHVSERVPVVSCGGVLLGWMQIFQRERVVWYGQLLCCGQRNQLVVCCLPRRQVLS